ncbi:MAG: hypothetical protein WCK38_01870, partial [Candidatus Omnitrophota bacterium]
SDDNIRAVYGGAGTDISNFLLSTNAAEGAFIARYKGLKQLDLERGRSLLASFRKNLPMNANYVVEKRRAGYAANTGVGWGIRDIVEQAVFELAFLGIDDFTVRTDDNGRPEIVFMWAYPGQASKTRVIVFVDEDVTDPAKYIDILKKPIDIYYQRAAENIPGDYTKGNCFINKIADSMREGGYFITDDYTTAVGYPRNPAPFPLGLSEVPVPGREERIGPVYKLRYRPAFNEGEGPDSLWFHYGWRVTVRQKVNANGATLQPQAQDENGKVSPDNIAPNTPIDYLEPKPSATINSTPIIETKTIIADRATMAKFHDWSAKMKTHLYRMLHLMEKLAAAESGGERMVVYKDLKACYIKVESACNSLYEIGLPEEISIGMMHHDMVQMITVVGCISQERMFGQVMAQDDVLNNKLFSIIYGGVQGMIKMESLASRIHGTFVMVHEPLNSRWRIDLEKSVEAASLQKDMEVSSRQTASSVSPARDVVQSFAAADSACRIDLETRPIADDERILLSESLFTDGTDRQELDKIILALAPILNKPGSHIEILKEEDIIKYLRVINGKSSKDKVAAILSQEDLNTNPYWKNPGTTESIKATVLFAGTKLAGANYLYLTGLIGFTRAVMAKDRDKVAMYYKLLTGDNLSGDVLKLLDIAGSNNTIPFALKLILKFRPIVKIDPVELENLRIAMENLLIAA